jgi:hypothetical protein
MADSATKSTEVVVQGTVLPLTERARDRWDSESIRLLAAKFGGNAPAWQLLALAELSARYDLDPWANEIWLANMGGRDGGGSSLALMVGRDGYMKVAKRDHGFISCAGQPVYENDELDVEIDETGGVTQFRFKPAHPGKRGNPLGAFALLRRKGLPTLYFFAPLGQFKKGGGAWKYEDPMIVKCAQSYLLRTTYNISGAVPHDEVSVGFDAEATATEVPARPMGQELPDAIMGLFKRAQRIDPLSWRLNEVEARVFDAAGEVLEDELRRVRLELHDWLVANDRDYDPRGHTDPAGPITPADPVVEDADVVEPGEVGVSYGGEGPGRFGAGEQVAGANGSPVPPPVADADAGEWYREACEAATQRFETDSEWAVAVRAKLSQVYDLEAALQGLEGDDVVGVQGDLERCEQELEALGVPRGWQPPPDPVDPAQEALL